MQQLGKAIKQGAIGIVVLTLFLYPMSAFAEAGDPASESSAPASETTTQQAAVPASNQGPTSPPGPEGKSYHYNASTGLWENDHYTWNPTTGETKANDSSAPTYNIGSGTWDTTNWRYDAPSGKYVPQTTKTPGPAPATAQDAATAQVQGGGSAAAASSGAGQTSALAVAGNTVSAAQADNIVQSVATSGNAAVSHNTTGGSATTGNAQSMINVLNVLQSSWGMPGNGDITTFTADINGSVSGDLLIDPSTFNGNVLPATGLTPSDLDVNIANSGHLDTTVVAGATSGNATVDHNTAAGGATTGTATAMANVINLINSTIGAGKSFIGTININGNFEDDILLPEALKSLLASGAVPTSSAGGDGSFAGTFNDSQSISNNISLGAQSGNAAVTGNTEAGGATTGNTNTNLAVFNMTGRQVIGSNALLVFVNVLGQWVGMIVDAPAGATAAMLGGGISSDNALPFGGDTNTTVSNNNSITNNILALARSGDATVDHNTSAGGATSGDAKASVNIANFMGSQLSLADWFGILFINVLGNWHGSFGIDTPIGNAPATPGQQPVSTSANTPVNDVRVFQFASSGGTALVKPASLNHAFKAVLASSHIASSDAAADGQVLSSAISGPSHTGGSNSIASKGSFSFWIVAITVLITCVLLTTERLLGHKQQTK